MCVCTCVHVCGQRQPCGIGSFLPLHGFQGLSSGHQACAAISCTCCAILLAPRLIVLKYKSLYLIFLCGTVLV